MWEMEYRLVKKRERELVTLPKGASVNGEGSRGAVNCSPTLCRRPEEGSRMIRNVLS